MENDRLPQQGKAVRGACPIAKALEIDMIIETTIRVILPFFNIFSSINFGLSSLIPCFDATCQVVFMV
jgi:hypothetical protein